MVKRDIVIIGAGPIGLACGIAASRAGFSHAIVDKGCLVNSIYHYPRNMTFFSTSERLEIGDVPFISQNPKPTRPEALEYYRRVARAWDLQTFLYEKVEKVSGEEGAFEVQTDRRLFACRYVIVATGFYDLPYLLHVPGEDLPKVKHYYDEPHPYYDMDILVVGAANSSVDAALETYRKGARSVTMVIREAELDEKVKYWVKPDIENRIKEGSIRAFFRSQILAIRDREVDIRTPEGAQTLPNDFVLAMTGYQPDFGLLRQMGVSIGGDPDQTPQYDPKTMQTNVPGIYLAGVICGGLKTSIWFIENSRVHAEMILSDLRRKSARHHDAPQPQSRP